jgi:hypothetical protein
MDLRFGELILQRFEVSLPNWTGRDPPVVGSFDKNGVGNFFGKDPEREADPGRLPLGRPEQRPPGLGSGLFAGQRQDVGVEFLQRLRTNQQLSVNQQSSQIAGAASMNQLSITLTPLAALDTLDEKSPMTDVVSCAAAASVRRSAETWRHFRKRPCRTNAGGRLSSCQ